MTYYGIVSLSVMDMYSQRMFPTNSSQSGWFTPFSFQRTEIIDVIVPSIGNAMRSTPADSSTLVDFYGLNLLAGSGSAAARICAALNPETTPILMSNQVQSKCDFPPSRPNRSPWRRSAMAFTQPVRRVALFLSHNS